MMDGSTRHEARPSIECVSLCLTLRKSEGEKHGEIKGSIADQKTSPFSLLKRDVVYFARNN